MTPEDLARAYYDAYVWSGCNGSRWNVVNAPVGLRVLGEEKP